MTTRLQAYRSRVPVNILQMIGVAARITLYLVGQTGPTSFIFRDRLNNKIKVSIGSTIRCSCQPSKNDHCIHSIYVMMRIFHIPQDNPIVWQASYLDSQLSDILAGKYSVAPSLHQRQQLASSSIMGLSFLDNHQTPGQIVSSCFDDQGILSTQAKVEALPLGQENPCPICQQQMKSDMLLSHCQRKCGNNFHLNCVKIWVQHKVSSNTPVTCPMCRVEWGPRVLQEISAKEVEFNKKQKCEQMKKMKLKFSCKGCGVDNLVERVHKCVFCEHYQLCQPCYLAGKHSKHVFILYDKGQWRGAVERREKERRMQEYLENRRKQSYTQDVVARMRKVNQDPSRILDFLAGAYPYVSKYISDVIDPLKPMDFLPEDLKCMSCGNTKIMFLRRLSCGHFIDHDCLKESILNKKFYCLIDGSKFLKGYEAMRKIMQQIEDPQKPTQLRHTPYPPRQQTSIPPLSVPTRYNSELPSELLFTPQQPPEGQTLMNLIGNIHQYNPSDQNNRLRQRIASNMQYEPTSQRQQAETPGHRIRVRNLSNGVPARIVPSPNINRIDKNRSQSRNRQEALRRQTGLLSQGRQNPLRRSGMPLGLQILVGRRMIQE